MTDVIEIATSRNWSMVRNLDLSARRKLAEFFIATVHNPNTRSAYLSACDNFFVWLDFNGVQSLVDIHPVHIGSWVEWMGGKYAPASIKQKLAAIRMLFNWLVVSQIIPISPCVSVKGPRHIVKKGRTSVLDGVEARQLIAAIDPSVIIGLRDRALIGLMIYSFARIGAALMMTCDDVYVQHRRLWVRLREKGGKQHDMPCHHELEEWLWAYLDKSGSTATDWLFRSTQRGGRELGKHRLQSANAYMMVKRRAIAAGVATPVTNHTFRATGITSYLSNNGTLEMAAKMANHASTKTTQLYDRRNDAVVLGEVERIRF